MKTLLVLLALSGFGLRWMPTNELWIRHEWRDCQGNTSTNYLLGIGKDGVMWLGQP
jgi:hypothetical protein